MNDVPKEKELTGKLIFEFDPEHPAQVDEIRKLLVGKDWALAMWDLDQHLRGLIKHGLSEASEETYKQVESIRTFLYECLSDKGLDFENDS